MASYRWKKEQVVLVDTHTGGEKNGRGEEETNLQRKEAENEFEQSLLHLAMTILCKYVSRPRGIYAGNWVVLLN